MLSRISPVLCSILLMGFICSTTAQSDDGDAAVNGAPNVSVSTLLNAVGTPYCMKPCVGKLAFSLKKLLTFNETTARLHDLCREYAETTKCLDKRKWCRMRNIFDAATSGVEHTCVTKKADFAAVESCLKQNLDGILQSCDTTCNVRTELANLSTATDIKNAARIGGNLFKVAKNLAPFCTAVRCGLPCLMKAANAACPKSGSLMIDSVFQPFDKAADLYAKAPQLTQKLVREHLSEKCLPFLEEKSLADMRTGKF